jgi:hypothetical protein
LLLAGDEAGDLAGRRVLVRITAYLDESAGDLSIAATHMDLGREFV